MASIFCLSSSAAALQCRSGALRVVSGEVAGTGVPALRGPSTSSSAVAAAAASSTAPLLVQPFAGRKCDLTGKKANNGYRVSFSHHRTKHLQGVNLQYKRLWWEEGKRWVRMRLSTKAIKTIEKKGLGVMAKEAGVNLLEFAV